MVQGITGSTALFHTKQMLDYGTQIVAGVTPGKGGQLKVYLYIILLLKEETGANVCSLCSAPFATRFYLSDRCGRYGYLYH